MNELETFVNNLVNIAEKGYNEETARKAISLINQFLYTTHDNIGTVLALDKQTPFLSEYHKYWNENYKMIINAKVDEGQCGKVADVLHEIYQKSEGKIYKEIWDDYGLNNKDVCKIRILTANQDFRGSRDFKDFVDCYIKNPNIFDVDSIKNNPDSFLKEIGITDLSQTDKRRMYAKNIAEFIKKHDCEPIELINQYQNNVKDFKEALVSFKGAGYGNKKADMFIRDMVVLDIWQNVAKFEEINVASDINTINIALRTGILKTSIPLVSSFLDIFGLQYSYIDEMSALAWKKVWEIWKKKYPKESIESPCLLDYLIYRIIGKEICKDRIYTYICENNDEVKDISGKSIKCPKCGGKLIKKSKCRTCEDTEYSKKVLKTTPLGNNKICNQEYENCPFYKICKEADKKNISAPKAISISGKTGWKTAYTDSKNGGGGIMA